MFQRATQVTGFAVEPHVLVDRALFEASVAPVAVTESGRRIDAVLSNLS